jgi:hypothetical protein
MSDLTIPTDSVLRRHFDQLSASSGLPPVPTDSVLRRHYLQRLDALANARAPVRAAPRAASAPERVQPRPAPAPLRAEPAVASTTMEPSSWFGRLLRKLGIG